MRIGVPKETWPGELRAALVPAAVKKLKALGFEISVESGLGAGACYDDEAYRDAGAEVGDDRGALLSAADLIARVRKPDADEVKALKPGAIHVSFLDPFNERALIETLAAQRTSAISMEMIPRSTRAQKMDALSSQASLAGYATVIIAAHHCPKMFPMMMTPAGTISPARIFVIGAGVAGLQAIATAKRLGGRVEAFDTRPAVAEQVQSLGAKFLEIDLGETGETEQGYARELSAEQLERQREGMKQAIAAADVVITTAQVFGRPAPRIVTADMVAAMCPGSILVDMAVETGGNVEGSVPDEVVNRDGVRIVGLTNLPSYVARDSSDMYANNIVNLVSELWDQESGRMRLDPEDDIVRSCLITRDGDVVNETIKNL